MIYTEPQKRMPGNLGGAARNWSSQIAQALANVDGNVVAELLGNVDQDTAKQIMANGRLHSRLAQMVEAAGYALPLMNSHFGAGVEQSKALTQNGFPPAKAMLAAFALAGAGQMVGADKRKSLVLEFGEQLIQQLWDKGAALLAILNTQEFSALLTQSADRQADLLSEYFSARGFGTGNQTFKIGPTKLPLLALDKAMVCLKESDINIAWPDRNMGLAA